MLSKTQTTALSAYQRDITRLARPRLNRETEAQYAREGRHDLLVESFLPMAIGAARKYAHSGAEFEDLIQNANIGLIIAARKFDPNRGFRFTTYATSWLRNFLARHAFEHGRMLRLPMHLMDANGAIRSGKATCPEDLERLFKMRPDRALAAFEVLTSRSFAPDTEDDEGRSYQLPSRESSPEDMFADAESQAEAQRLVEAGLAALDERERKIIEQRLLAPDDDESTLQEIGVELGVSRERVRQVEAQAREKMRRAIRLARETGPIEPSAPPKVEVVELTPAAVRYAPPKEQKEAERPARVLGQSVGDGLREEAVRRVLSGETVSDVSRSMRFKRETIRRWIESDKHGVKPARHSEATRARAVALVRGGMSIARAAVECGASHPTITKWCAAAGVRSQVTHGESGASPGVRARAAERARTGESATAIALDLGVSPQTVWKWCREYGVELDAHRGIGSEKREAMVASVRAGATYSDVADEFAVTIATVKKWCGLAGVKSPLSRDIAPDAARPTAFDPAVRESTVNRVRNGESIVRVANTSGISATTVTKWCRRAGVESSHPPAVLPRSVRLTLVAAPETPDDAIAPFELPISLHRAAVAILGIPSATNPRALLAAARGALDAFEARALSNGP